MTATSIEAKGGATKSSTKSQVGRGGALITAAPAVAAPPVTTGAALVYSARP